MREVPCEKVVLVTAEYNSLLNRAFGLMLLHLGLTSANLRPFSAKSQETVTVPRM
jgi:hypothetical protein